MINASLRQVIEETGSDEDLSRALASYSSAVDAGNGAEVRDAHEIALKRNEDQPGGAT